MRKTLLITLVAGLFVCCAPKAAQIPQTPRVIPQPNGIELKGGSVSFDRFGRIVADAQLLAEAQLLQESLSRMGYELELGKGRGKAVKLVYDPESDEES